MAGLPPSLDTLAAALGDSLRQAGQGGPQGNLFTLEVSFLCRLRQRDGRWQFDVLPAGRRPRGPALRVRIGCDATGTRLRIDTPPPTTEAAR